LVVQPPPMRRYRSSTFCSVLRPHSPVEDGLESPPPTHRICISHRFRCPSCRDVPSDDNGRSRILEWWIVIFSFCFRKHCLIHLVRVRRFRRWRRRGTRRRKKKRTRTPTTPNGGLPMNMTLTTTSTALGDSHPYSTIRGFKLFKNERICKNLLIWLSQVA